MKKPSTTVDPRRFYLMHLLMIWSAIEISLQIIHHHVYWYTVVIACFVVSFEIRLFTYWRRSCIRRDPS